MKKLKAALLTAGLGIALAIPLVGAPDAEAHGWVTNPPSRQDHCSTGTTSFDCGGIKYEPQSVEAPKGSMKCSGGNEGFSILDDESRPWPVTKIDSSVDIKWKITARHSTSTWDYFLDGELIAQWDDKGARPDAVVTHSLTNLPAGKHTIFARWNVADTANAFYSCIDVEVTGNGGGNDDNGNGNDGNTDNGAGEDGNTDNGSGENGTEENGSGENGSDENGGTEKCAAEWSDSEVYLASEEVTYDGKIYRANWWTQGDNPAEAGQWGAWTLIGDCDEAGNGDDGNTEDGNAEDGNSDDGNAEDGDGNGDDGNAEDGNGEEGSNETCDVPAWDASQVYNGGDQVSHEGDLFEANWWTQGDTPTDGSPWAVWVKTGTCAA